MQQKLIFTSMVGCCIFSSVVGGEDLSREGHAKEAFEANRYKEAIERYRQLADSSPPELKGEWLEKLAFAYYRDQNDVAAFTAYLQALDSIARGNAPAISPEEQSYYDEAMRLYLDPSHSSPKELAVRIKQTYGPIVSQHPHYFLLNFFISSAYANLGMFDEFFDRFYSSYQAFPDSYFAVKIKGVLHIKLFERLTDPVQREQEREKALKCLLRARNLNPKDTGLYKMLIVFSTPDRKREALHSNLTMIVEQDLQVPRIDIPFYMEEAIRFEEYELAEKFLNNARHWYPYSKIINMAEQTLQRKIDIR